MPAGDPPRTLGSSLLRRAADRTPQPWRNGGGVTFEVARRSAPPQSGREFLWRVSIARVESPGPFSSFAGFERLIAVIEGPGMRLTGLGPQDVDLRPFEAFRFDGAASVAGAPPGGPVSDLNVIFDPQRCTARLAVIRDAPVERRAACADLLIVNLAPAPIECAVDSTGFTLARHDAIWIASPGARVSCRAVARAALVEIDSASGNDRAADERG